MSKSIINNLKKYRKDLGKVTRVLISIIVMVMVLAIILSSSGLTVLDIFNSIKDMTVSMLLIYIIYVLISVVIGLFIAILLSWLIEVIIKKSEGYTLVDIVQEAGQEEVVVDTTSEDFKDVYNKLP